MQSGRSQRSRAFRLAFVALPLVLSGNGVARAEEPEAEARRLYADASHLVDAGLWADALPLFERSARLLPSYRTTFNMAICEWRTAHLTRARYLLLRAVAERERQPAAGPSRDADEWRGLARSIEQELARATLTIDPPGAAITVDGRPLAVEAADASPPLLSAGIEPLGAGSAPPAPTVTVLVDPGRHHLTLTRPGYKPVGVDVDFPRGAPITLRYPMDRLPATLRITSAEAGAVVQLDGVDVGEVPVEVQRAAGVHRVVLRKPAFDEARGEIIAQAGESVSLDLPLRRHRSLWKSWQLWVPLSAAVVVGAGVAIWLAWPNPEEDPGGLQWISRP